MSSKVVHKEERVGKGLLAALYDNSMHPVWPSRAVGMHCMNHEGCLSCYDIVYHRSAKLASCLRLGRCYATYNTVYCHQ